MSNDATMSKREARFIVATSRLLFLVREGPFTKNFQLEQAYTISADLGDEFNNGLVRKAEQVSGQKS
jgi:hypothetical protein